MNKSSVIAKRLPWIVPQTATVHVHQLTIAKSEPYRVAHFYVVEDGQELRCALVFAVSPKGLLSGAQHDLIEQWAAGIVAAYGAGYTVRPLEIDFSEGRRCYLTLGAGTVLKAPFEDTVAGAY